MKAWVYRKSGKPGDILKLENDWPKPEPKSKQIQVKVHTVSLNPVGWKTMYVFPLSAGQKKPCCPEYDVAGEVSGGDLSGTDLQIGDHVIAFLPHDTVMKSGQGALYEYVVAEQHMVVKKPSNLSMAEACTFPLAGLTVYQNVMKLGGLKKGSGQRVFINGGSGGVGAYAVQLAKAYQAFVVTTSSPASQDLVSSFKPDATIDYRNVNLPEVLQRDYNVKDGKGFDIIFDSVGSGPLYDNAKYYLKSDGVFADVGECYSNIVDLAECSSHAGLLSWSTHDGIHLVSIVRRPDADCPYASCIPGRQSCQVQLCFARRFVAGTFILKAGRLSVFRDS